MSKVLLVCRVMTLCVADLIWGVCRDSYTLVSSPPLLFQDFSHVIDLTIPTYTSFDHLFPQLSSPSFPDTEEYVFPIPLAMSTYSYVSSRSASR